MASDHHAKSVHNTLSTTTADKISFDQPWGGVEVTNNDASVRLFAAKNATAVSAADGTEVIEPGTSKIVFPGQWVGDPDQDFSAGDYISIVGNGNIYSAEGVH